MTSVVKLAERKLDADLIAMLESALEDAKAGRTTGVLLIQKRLGASSWSCVGIEDRFEITGYLFHLAYKMQNDDDPLPGRAG